MGFFDGIGKAIGGFVSSVGSAVGGATKAAGDFVGKTVVAPVTKAADDFGKTMSRGWEEGVVKPVTGATKAVTGYFEDKAKTEQKRTQTYNKLVAKNQREKELMYAKYGKDMAEGMMRRGEYYLTASEKQYILEGKFKKEDVPKYWKSSKGVPKRELTPSEVARNQYESMSEGSSKMTSGLTYEKAQAQARTYSSAGFHTKVVKKGDTYNVVYSKYMTIQRGGLAGKILSKVIDSRVTNIEKKFVGKPGFSIVEKYKPTPLIIDQSSKAKAQRFKNIIEQNRTFGKKSMTSDQKFYVEKGYYPGDPVGMRAEEVASLYKPDEIGQAQKRYIRTGSFISELKDKPKKYDIAGYQSYLDTTSLQALELKGHYGKIRQKYETMDYSSGYEYTFVDLSGNTYKASDVSQAKSYRDMIIKQIQDQEQKIEDYRTNLTEQKGETKKWDPRTKVAWKSLTEGTEYYFEPQFEYAGAEDFRKLKKTQEDNPWSLLATAFTPEDPLGIPSLLTTISGQFKEYVLGEKGAVDWARTESLSIKGRAIQRIWDIEKQGGLLTPAGAMWVMETPLTQIALAAAGTKGFAGVTGRIAGLSPKAAIAVQAAGAGYTAYSTGIEAVRIGTLISQGKGYEATRGITNIGLSVVGALGGGYRQTYEYQKMIGQQQRIKGMALTGTEKARLTDMFKLQQQLFKMQGKRPVRPIKVSDVVQSDSDVFHVKRFLGYAQGKKTIKHGGKRYSTISGKYGGKDYEFNEAKFLQGRYIYKRTGKPAYYAPGKLETLAAKDPTIMQRLRPMTRRDLRAKYEIVPGGSAAQEAFLRTRPKGATEGVWARKPGDLDIYFVPKRTLPRPMFEGKSFFSLKDPKRFTGWRKNVMETTGESWVSSFHKTKSWTAKALSEEFWKQPMTDRTGKVIMNAKTSKPQVMADIFDIHTRGKPYMEFSEFGTGYVTKNIRTARGSDFAHQLRFGELAARKFKGGFAPYHAKRGKDYADLIRLAKYYLPKKKQHLITKFESTLPQLSDARKPSIIGPRPGRIGGAGTTSTLPEPKFTWFERKVIRPYATRPGWGVDKKAKVPLKEWAHPLLSEKPKRTPIGVRIFGKERWAKLTYSPFKQKPKHTHVVTSGIPAAELSRGMYYIGERAKGFIVPLIPKTSSIVSKRPRYPSAKVGEPIMAYPFAIPTATSKIISSYPKTKPKKSGITVPFIPSYPPDKPFGEPPFIPSYPPDEPPVPPVYPPDKPPVIPPVVPPNYPPDTPTTTGFFIPQKEKKTPWFTGEERKKKYKIELFEDVLDTGYRYRKWKVPTLEDVLGIKIK